MKLALKRVDKLVALSVLGSVIGVWLVLTGFDAVTMFVRQLGNIGKNGYTLTDATVYVLVTTPRRAYELWEAAGRLGPCGRELCRRTAGELERLAAEAAGSAESPVAAQVVLVDAKGERMVGMFGRMAR